MNQRFSKQKHAKEFAVRVRWLFFVFIPLAALLLIANLFHLQVQQGSEFRERADNQYVAASYNAFERGSIYFKEKDGDLITAAGQKRGYKVTINPSKTTNPEELFETINAIAPIEDKEKFLKEAATDRTYYEVVNELSSEQSKDLQDALGRKIQMYSEKWRVYPLDIAAAHSVGIMAFQEDDYEGRYGLERYYEKTLARTDKGIYTNFFARIFHGVQDIVDTDTTLEGDIVTSIEPQVQIYFDGILFDIQERWNSELTGGIVMHPQTGEIYALGVTPSFDPNDFSDVSLSQLQNPLVESIYELGSIIKPLVVAAAWDAGDINEQTTYNDLGSVVVGPHRIYNFDKEGRGMVDIQEILTQSLNTGMVYISQRMNKDDFRTYFKNYGFGEPTGIDLPNEAKGIVSNLSSNRDIEFANMSFGQGIALTPVQMVQAMSALGNGGKTVTPHLVTKISYENGFSKTMDYEDQGVQVIRPETASEVTRMMVNVFDSYNEGRTKIPHYSVAAKTGTAQIPAPNGGYYTDRNLHSFVGYFPAYDPQFLVFLYTIHPKGVRYASQSLLDPFRDTAQYLINYYNLPPDR